MASQNDNPIGYKNEDLLDFSDYLPKRFAINYELKIIVLEYMVRSTGKLHHHKMKLLRVTADSDIDEMYDYLVSRHSMYISKEKVAKTQITSLIQRLKDWLFKDKENSGAQQFTEGSALSKVSVPEVKQKVEEEAGWGDGWGEEEQEEEVDYNTHDLNKLDTLQLNKVKSNMDVEFHKNRITPDHPEYKHDVRKDFDEEAQLEGSWDDGMVSNDEEDDYFEDDFL
jgi:hypothetical protein